MSGELLGSLVGLDSLNIFASVEFGDKCKRAEKPYPEHNVRCPEAKVLDKTL